MCLTAVYLIYLFKGASNGGTLAEANKWLPCLLSLSLFFFFPGAQWFTEMVRSYILLARALLYSTVQRDTENGNTVHQAGFVCSAGFGVFLLQLRLMASPIRRSRRERWGRFFFFFVTLEIKKNKEKKTTTPKNMHIEGQQPIRGDLKLFCDSFRFLSPHKPPIVSEELLCTSACQLLTK